MFKLSHRALKVLIIALAFAVPAARARAHSASSSYLHVDVSGRDLSVQWSIALRDLDYALGLDEDGDGAITWGEVRRQQAAIGSYALARLRLSADGAQCDAGTRPIEMLADKLADGAYAVLRFHATCPAPPTRVSVKYSLLFDLDPLHRGLLTLTLDGVAHAAALSPTNPIATFDGTTSYGETIRSFFQTGVGHLLTGIDHMLFVTMLLLPAMLRRGNKGFGPHADMLPVSNFWGMFAEALKVLSAFTLAHGTTLTLSVLHLVYIPQRLSEAGIALTILVTALDNILHFLPRRRWPLAFAFGLVHGLGFATALGPMDLPPLALGTALIAFNLGLEAAQVTIAAFVLPAGFFLRNTFIYPKRIMPGISMLVALVALAWFTDRAVDLRMMPF